MTDDAIQELTRIMLKIHKETPNDYVERCIRMCIKVLRLMKEIYDE